MSRKLSYDYPDEPNRWVISYADFITMLLALFMVLYAISQLDIAKMRDFTKSLNSSFSSIKIDTKEKKKLLTAIFSTTSARIICIPVEMTPNQQVEELKKRLKEVEEKLPNDMKEFEKTKNTLEEDLKSVKDIKVVNAERGLVISLADSVLFDSGSSQVKPNALPTLDKIAQIVKNLPNSVRIEGYTDNQPISTSLYPSNWELSTARATSLVKLFVNKYKLSPEKLSAAGYGEFRPIATNTTPEGRQTNRRVDIVILSSGSQIFEPQNSNESE